MKVLIVGGGIAGLALAAQLRARGITPKIVEQAPVWAHKGFVLGIWGKGLHTLAGLTTMERIDSIGYESTVFKIRDKDGKVIKHLSFKHLVNKYGPVILTHRAAFHELLQDLARDIPITFGATVTRITQNKDNVTVIFSNNHEETFDLVVGADGIRSTVRRLVFGDGWTRYSGLSGWIYMAPPSVHFPKNASEMWVGDRFFGVYPDKETRLCTIFAQRLPEGAYRSTAHVAYLKETFANFGWIVPQVLASMDETDDIFFDNWDEVFLSTWTKGRVALIGDAAHASPPATGMGACMALEDALVLASELALQASGNLEGALSAYQQKRRRHVHMVQRQSDMVERFKYIDSQPSLFFRNAFLRFVPSSVIVRDFEYMLSE